MHPPHHPITTLIYLTLLLLLLTLPSSSTTTSTPTSSSTSFTDFKTTQTLPRKIKIIDTVIKNKDWPSLQLIAKYGLSQSQSNQDQHEAQLSYHYYLGISQFSLGDIQSSVQSLTLAVIEIPNNPEIIGILGDAQLSLFNCISASQSFENAWKLEKGSKKSFRYMNKMIKAKSWVADFSSDYLTSVILGRIQSAVVLSNNGYRERAVESLGGVGISDVSLEVERLVGLEGWRLLNVFDERTITNTNTNTNSKRLSSSSRSPSTPLRIGFISSDFGVHPISQLIRGLIHSLSSSPSIYNLTLFSLHTPPPLLQWWYTNLTSLAPMVDLDSYSTYDASEVVRGYDLDVIVELNGHTLTSGLNILSYKPAPIQISYLGLPRTTGKEYIDYYIGDDRSVVSEEGGWRWFSEKAVVLRGCYIGSDYGRLVGHGAWRGVRNRVIVDGDADSDADATADTDRPTISAPRSSPTSDPQHSQRTVTSPIHLAVFSNFQKLTPSTLDLYANILRQTPNAYLTLTQPSAHKSAAPFVLTELKARGINAERRVLWLPQTPWIEHTWVKSMFDLCLDTLVKNGHTTGLDAAWAGVPCVTLNSGGGNMGTRAGVSIDGGLYGSSESESGSGTMSFSLKDYEELSVKLVSDGRVRGGVRGRLEDRRLVKGGLFDAEAFASAFGEALVSIVEKEGMDVGRMHIYKPTPVSRSMSVSNEKIALYSAGTPGGDTRAAPVKLARSTIYTSTPSPKPPPRQKPLHLHIGGREVKEGWTIIDLSQTTPSLVDVTASMGHLPMYSNNTVDTVYCSHALEHAHYGQSAPAGSSYSVLQVLNEWHRVLKVGGNVMISVPDMQVLTTLYTEAKDANDRFLIMRMIFGGQVDEYDVHYVGFDADVLAEFMRLAGFCRVRRVEDFGMFEDTSRLRWKGDGVLISLSVVGVKCL